MGLKSRTVRLNWTYRGNMFGSWADGDAMAHEHRRSAGISTPGPGWKEA